jgi:murein DD-endopeptidase MepM/ murein hydrolase activator NlpD
MGFFSKLRELRNAKFTIMIIPDSRKKVVQFDLSKFFIYSVMTLVIGLSSYYVVKNLYLEALNDHLYTSNNVLQDEIDYRDDKIEKLYALNYEQEDEMAFLKKSVSSSALYFEEKLEDLNELEDHVGDLLAMINDRGDTALSLPISRSIDHSMLLAINEEQISSPNVIDDLKNVTLFEDEISSIIQEQVTKYDDLIGEVSSQLDFMECYPDYSPTDGYVTSGYGYRTDPFSGLRTFHRGLDIANSKGTEIHAAGSGIVTYSGYNGNYGNMVVISHGYDYETVYAHNNENLVKVGDIVEKGNVVALMGSTGKSTGPHVHFEVHFEGTQMNPRITLTDY